MENRACLDFLLGELRRWQHDGRLPESLVAPLVAEYAARRAALDPPVRYPVASPSPPEPVAPPPARWSLGAFLEERNIAALHLVGSLLLLVGLVLLVQWQWNGIGRFLLLAIVGLAAVGLMRLSDSLRDEHPNSASALGLVGALLVPLCGVAVRVLGVGDLLSWPLTVLLTSVVSGAVYMRRLQTTGELTHLGLLALAGAGAVGGAAALLPDPFGWPAGIAGLLGLAALSLRQIGKGEPTWDQPLTVCGHALTLAAIATSLFWGVQTGGDLPKISTGLVLLGASALYGLTSSRLELPRLAYGTVVSAALGAQLLLPDTARVATHGATLAATGALLLLLTRLQERVGTEPAPAYRQSAPVLTVLGALPLLLETAPKDLPLAGLFIALALLWRTVPGLTPTLSMGIAAARLLAIPLDSWFVSVSHWPANEFRWLVLPALALSVLHLRASAEDERPLRLSALGCLLWAGLAQVPELGKLSGQGVLSLEALVLALWGWRSERLVLSRAALLPLGAVSLAHWFYPATSLPLVGIALLQALVGLALVSRACLAERALLWLLAAGHLAAGLLPESLRAYWSLALVPVLLWLDHAEGESEAPLRLTEFFTVLSFIAAVLLPTGVSPLSVGITGGLLALLPLWRRTASGVSTACALITATVALVVSGYPQPHLSLAQVGLLLAGMGLFWQALATLLRQSSDHGDAVSKAGLGTATVAAALALAGLTQDGQGLWTILALGLNAASLASASALRKEPALAHSAFACAYAAFALYYYDRVGLGTDRFALFFLPLGVYLLVIAEKANEAPLRSLGTLVLLGSSLLAVLTEPTSWGHASLLVAECLAALGLGIVRRVKVYVGGGIGFLIALLVLKLWDPLREVNFGVYLTLLGVGVLALALQFEKRREALRTWIADLKERYADWS